MADPLLAASQIPYLMDISMLGHIWSISAPNILDTCNQTKKVVVLATTPYNNLAKCEGVKLHNAKPTAKHCDAKYYIANAKETVDRRIGTHGLPRFAVIEDTIL